MLKRILVVAFVVCALSAALAVVLWPWMEQYAKRYIAEQVRGFIREGSVEIGDISGTLNRRQIRIRDVRIRDVDGHTVIDIGKIDINVMDIHHGHIDAKMSVFEPKVTVHEKCVEEWGRLFRAEAFLEDGILRVDRITVSSGSAAFILPAVLTDPETLAFNVSAAYDKEQRWICEFEARGPRTEIGGRADIFTIDGVSQIAPGAWFSLASTNIAGVSGFDFADSPASRALPRVSARFNALDTVPRQLSAMRWDASLNSKNVQASVSGLAAEIDTVVSFRADTAHAVASRGAGPRVDASARGVHVVLDTAIWIRVVNASARAAGFLPGGAAGHIGIGGFDAVIGGPVLYARMDTMHAAGLGEIFNATDNRVEWRDSRLRISAGRLIRRKTGLALDDVWVRADSSTADLSARIDTIPVSVSAAWGPLPGRFKVAADSLAIEVICGELGETLPVPVSGLLNLRADVSTGETESSRVSWKMNILSSDLRFGSNFGKIMLRVNFQVRGADTTIDEITGTVEPSPGVAVVVSGRPGRRGGFTGKAVLRDRSLKDIRLLTEAFGRDLPLSGESGRAGLDVDFRITPDLQLYVKGSLKIAGASFQAKRSPFRIDGMDADILFERSPDTGKLILDEIPSGLIKAQRIVLGPYELRNFVVTTKSRGDKLYADVPPVSFFGGYLRAKALFYFSDAAHQLEITADSVSLTQILNPIPDAREALSGLVHGYAKVSIRRADVKAITGQFSARTTAGIHEPMIVSRPFLENIGGAVIQKLDLPKRVPYESGMLKIHFADGRIWFDESSLEAKTLLRRIRIGKVIGSYPIYELIDVLSNVSTDKVKIEIGGKKQK